MNVRIPQAYTTTCNVLQQQDMHKESGWEPCTLMLPFHPQFHSDLPYKAPFPERVCKQVYAYGPPSDSDASLNSEPNTTVAEDGCGIRHACMPSSPKDVMPFQA